MFNLGRLVSPRQAQPTYPADARYRVRKLEAHDYEKGFLKTLSQLSDTVGLVGDNTFYQRFKDITARFDAYVLVVCEDQATGRIVGAASLFIELKFIHNCGKAGHIEDVVVDRSLRKSGIGKLLMAELERRAWEMGCYKVILDCAESNVFFYEKCGYKKKEVQMAKYANAHVPEGSSSFDAKKAPGSPANVAAASAAGGTYGAEAGAAADGGRRGLGQIAPLLGAAAVAAGVVGLAKLLRRKPRRAALK